MPGLPRQRIRRRPLSINEAALMGGFLLAMRFLGSGISRFFWWLVKHPHTLVVVVTAAISGLAVGHWMRNRYEDRIASLERDLGRFQEADQIRTQRIKELETSTAKAGDALDKQREDTARQLAGITEKYSQALVSDRGRQQTLICSPPATPGAAANATPTQVQVQFEDGHVVCDRFPQAFANVVNQSMQALQKQLAKP